jgi:hypothetical protein
MEENAQKRSRNTIEIIQEELREANKKERTQKQ